MPRPSPVSDEVKRLLQTGGRHAWSLAELTEAVRTSVAGASYSTIFRACASLERAGVVQRFEVGDGTSRFELRDDHHEHIRCESCGRVADVRDCVVPGAARRIESETGFAVTGHHVVFTGLCADCSADSHPEEHSRLARHPHQHGEGCGHQAVPHDDHVDYLHAGHRHAAHGDHWDEHQAGTTSAL